MTRTHFFLCRIAVFLCLFLPSVEAKINSQLTDNDAAPQTPQKTETLRAQSNQKEWTFLIYFAGVNDLGTYIPFSLMQAQSVGGHSNFNIVAEVDRHGSNDWLYKPYTSWAREIGHPPLNIVDTPTERPRKESKDIVRLEVGKNKIFCHESAPKTKRNASGTRTALYDFIKWGVTNFPAKHYALFIWNHGNGAIDMPSGGWNFDPNVINPPNWPPEEPQGKRGIATNDIERTYLSGPYLDEVLAYACKNILGGKRFDLLCLDACLMAMVESYVQFGDSADYIVASQEVGWGSGWNYAESLRPLLTEDLTPRELAKHIVSAYRDEMLGKFIPKEYKKYYPELDFTLSAVDTTRVAALNDAVENLAQHMIAVLQPAIDHKGASLRSITDPEQQQRLANGRALRDALHAVRSDTTKTTSFYGNSYIDLHHFCVSMRTKIDPSMTLFALLVRVENAIVGAVIKNTHSPITLPYVRGVSIYFPRLRKYPAYKGTRFAQTNAWDTFLASYRAAL